eukprot:6177838-Pleurochrysis_carterae.AAC.5
MYGCIKIWNDSFLDLSPSPGRRAARRRATSRSSSGFPKCTTELEVATLLHERSDDGDADFDVPNDSRPFASQGLPIDAKPACDQTGAEEQHWALHS